MSNKQLTDEEKEFNKAMCTICLLEWPMAQCLSCKFHPEEKEVMYNGFIPTVSKKILDAIELSTLAELVNENHDNLYWQGRLEAKRQQMEIARDDAWLNSESDREGTEPSPIISGGEVLYITNPTGNDDIPF